MTGAIIAIIVGACFVVFATLLAIWFCMKAKAGAAA
jgi:hypothetical protein